MNEIYKMLVDYTIWPILLAILCYLWKEQSARIKSIESKFIRIEKELVRISTLVESYISKKLKPG